MFYRLASRWGPGELDQICWSELDFGSQLISASSKAGGVPGYPRWSQTQRLHCFQKPSRPSNILKHYPNSQVPTQSETEGSKEYLKLCCAHPLNFGKITPKATLQLTMFPVGSSSWCLVFYSLGVVRLLTQLWAALADLWTLLYSGQETSFKSINYSSALCSILRGGEHHILQETYMRV